jgi:hypothetical protein
MDLHECDFEILIIPDDADWINAVHIVCLPHWMARVCAVGRWRGVDVGTVLVEGFGTTTKQANE